MDKILASELITASGAINEELNRIAEIVERISEREEKLGYRKSVSELMADIYIKLIGPIIQEHRDLDPDKDIV